jgi:uncharacterized protein (DUF1810 family)
MNLERFKEAQNQADSGFDLALREMRDGHKRSHWIWYVFPQLAGLGQSPAARLYAIADVAEAMAYLRDPVLFDRLRTVTTTAATHAMAGVPLATLMGSTIDVLKLVSSLTLFERVARDVARNDGNEEHLAFARSAAALLELAESQGYPRCRYTLERLGPEHR